MKQSFYQVLVADDRFDMAVGRLTLASAKLESAIKAFIEFEGIVNVKEKMPLGALTKNLIEKHGINRTVCEHLQLIVHERNYFVHKLHANLSEYPENYEDLSKFIGRAESLSKEMEFFSSLIFNSINRQGENYEQN